jgi:hypothetical protein
MDEHESMVRWQGYARDQRSAVNSLFLTYAAALIGLQSSMLMNREVSRIEQPTFFSGAALAAAVSLIAGCIVVLVRLRDARLTARISRFRVEKKPLDELDALRRKANRAGWWTNVLLPIQVGTFALATVVFVAWIVRAFGAKLLVTTG